MEGLGQKSGGCSSAPTCLGDPVSSQRVMQAPRGWAILLTAAIPARRVPGTALFLSLTRSVCAPPLHADEGTRARLGRGLAKDSSLRGRWLTPRALWV